MNDPPPRAVHWGLQGQPTKQCLGLDEASTAKRIYLLRIEARRERVGEYHIPAVLAEEALVIPMMHPISLLLLSAAPILRVDNSLNEFEGMTGCEEWIHNCEE